LLSSFGAVVAGLLIERQPFPGNYALCFSITFGMMILSYIAIAFTKESEHEITILQSEQPHLLHSIRDILRRDRNFAWFLVGRTAVQFGTMAFSFYTVYATTRLNAGPYAVGILTSVLMISQVVTNLLLGMAADRWSRKGVLELGAVAILLSALIARFAPSIGWMYPAVILAAVANTAFWTISMALVLQFGEEHERPTYIGMSNTLIAPATIVAPLVGGWLADARGYQSTFLVAAAAGLLSTIIMVWFVKDPRPKK
jgi:predicted MFS family arabinose efflux permease